jgi:hypothetical protein
MRREISLSPSWFLLRTGLNRSDAHSAMLRVSATAASNLLKTQREIVVLHGDMHHGNVLHFGSRGWLAIDPRGSSEKGISITPTSFVEHDFALAGPPQSVHSGLRYGLIAFLITYSNSRSAPAAPRCWQDCGL